LLDLVIKHHLIDALLHTEFPLAGTAFISRRNCGGGNDTWVVRSLREAAPALSKLFRGHIQPVIAARLSKLRPAALSAVSLSLSRPVSLLTSPSIAVAAIRVAGSAAI
jgi:hypothetical protein